MAFLSLSAPVHMMDGLHDGYLTTLAIKFFVSIKILPGMTLSTVPKVPNSGTASTSLHATERTVPSHQIVCNSGSAPSRVVLTRTCGRSNAVSEKNVRSLFETRRKRVDYRAQAEACSITEMGAANRGLCQGEKQPRMQG